MFNFGSSTLTRGHPIPSFGTTYSCSRLVFLARVDNIDRVVAAARIGVGHSLGGVWQECLTHGMEFDFS